MTTSRRDEMIWEIETRLGYMGYEWRAGVSPSSSGKREIAWSPWVGTFTFRNSAIRAARRYVRKFTGLTGDTVWRDVEHVKLPDRKVRV